MTRIALSITLAILLVVGGIVIYQVQTGANNEPRQRSDTPEAIGSDGLDAIPETTIEDLAETGDSAIAPSSSDEATVTSSVETHDHSHSEGSTGTTTPTTIEAATGPLVIPATIPYPRGLFNGEGYEFRTFCGEVVDREGNLEFECPLEEERERGIADLEYFGHGMPYLYSEAVDGNHDHAWWIAGDREGYRCAYGFMYDKHPNPFGMFEEDRPAELIARATIVQPVGAAYGAIIDAGMDEAVRYYDGTLTGGVGGEIPEEDCQQTALDDFDYDGYVPQGADQIRVGLFRADGEIGDIRDFTQIAIGPLSGHFEFIDFDGQRVTIVFILHGVEKVSHVFYYDTLGSGRIAVEVNGKLHQ